MSSLLTHHQFHQAILARPEDWLPRLIYADWLEEQGDPRGEVIRLLHSLLRFDCEQRDEKVARLQKVLAGDIDMREVTPRIRLEAINLELALIPPGEFLMGSPPQESDRREQEFQHPVRLTRPWFLGVHPVTQRQFETLMEFNPSDFGPSGSFMNYPAEKGLDVQNLPVEYAYWQECVEWCNRLSREQRKPLAYALGNLRRDDRQRMIGADVVWHQAVAGFRLPTEAEWEFACRAGTDTPFHFGHELTPGLANFKSDDQHPVEVGTYPANAFGLHEMHGNVWEWCWDWSGLNYYHESPVENPTGPTDNVMSRIFRGGSWGEPAHLCRSACRHDFLPESHNIDIGFRVALSLP